MLWLDEVDSTMAEANRLAAHGAAHGTAVAAGRQLAGRGRLGRSWHSPTGGCWLSVVLRPRVSPSLETLALRIGLAVADALEAHCRELPALRLKWPNDLIAENRKVGGILVEARWSGEECLGVLAGVGINLLNAIPDRLAGTAAALGAMVPVPARARLEPRLVAEPLARAIGVAGRGGELSAAELARWAERDWLRGRAVEGPVAGVVEGVSAAGALLVRDADGVIHPVRSGVVTPGS